MKYAVEMGSSAMIYIPSFINTGSGIQKLIRTDTYTKTEEIAEAYFRKAGRQVLPSETRMERSSSQTLPLLSLLLSTLRHSLSSSLLRGYIRNTTNKRK
jgi:hypothetical protein